MVQTIIYFYPSQTHNVDHSSFSLGTRLSYEIGHHSIPRSYPKGFTLVTGGIFLKKVKPNYTMNANLKKKTLTISTHV